MSRSRLAPHPGQPAAIDLRWLPALCRRLLIGTVAVMLLLGVRATGVAHAEEYVFSIGILVKIDQRTITLGFEDGTTETYRIGPETTIRSQNGDERSLADFELGNPVLIITPAGDSTAFTVVDGGPTGFHEAGPADIRGHEGTCAGCGAEPADHPRT
jgi:hypothetical protein